MRVTRSRSDGAPRTQASWPGLTRPSTSLHLPGKQDVDARVIGERKRRRPSDGYARARRRRMVRSSVATHAPAFSRRGASEVWPTASLKQRGRECRARARTRSLACEKKQHTSSVATGTPHQPAFPARWFYGFLRALPGDRAFLPPSLVNSSTNLAPASGRQNHTTSPSASVPFVSDTFASTTSRATFRDDRDTPLLWVRDGTALLLFLPNEKAKYFCERDWTTQISLNCFNKLEFARTIAGPVTCPMIGSACFRAG
jgi:hypothetical protein